MSRKQLRVVVPVLLVLLILGGAAHRLYFQRAASPIGHAGRGALRAAPAGEVEEIVPVGTADRPLDRIVIGLRRISGKEKLVTRASGPLRVFDGETGEPIGVIAAGARLVITVEPNAARVVARAPGWERRRTALRLVPASGSEIRAGRSRYAGALAVRARDGRLVVTNEIDLERYLLGVVPGEVPDYFALEAQKALAVAARTYTLMSRGKHAAEGFDLCDGTHCQMYVGLLAWAPRGKRAVRDTRGLFAWHGDRPIHTFYSADCGGRTSNNEDILFSDMPRRPLPYLRAVADRPGEGEPNYCASSRHQQWTRTRSAAELAAALNRYPETRVGILTGIRFVAYDSSGRVKRVRLEGLLPPGPVEGQPFIGPPAPVVREVDGWTFRRGVGWRVLKSTLARLRRPAPDRYVFVGRGFGHGVGLCQIGANGMAGDPHRRSFREILAHYYPGAHVAPLAGRTGRAVPSLRLTQASGTEIE